MSINCGNKTLLWNPIFFFDLGVMIKNKTVTHFQYNRFEILVAGARLELTTFGL